MHKTSMINTVLLIILLVFTTILFSVEYGKQNYQAGAEQMQSVLADQTVANYFNAEEITANYQMANSVEEVVLRPICVDCKETIADQHNSNSALIVEAPESICDTEIERCVLYSYDPFGFGIFTHQEILRSQKVEV